MGMLTLYYDAKRTAAALGAAVTWSDAQDQIAAIICEGYVRYTELEFRNKHIEARQELLDMFVRLHNVLKQAEADATDTPYGRNA